MADCFLPPFFICAVEIKDCGGTQTQAIKTAGESVETKMRQANR